jgi:peptide/nickel transport system permease protein
MFAYTMRRILAAIPILIASSFLAFVLVNWTADPVRAKYGGRNPPVPKQTLLNESHRMRLDQGFLKGYWTWISGVVRGDFGPSIETANRNLRTDLFHAAGITLRLVLLAMLIALVLAVLTGVLSAYKQYSMTDYTFTFLGFVFVAMPAFWIAALLKTGAISFNDAVEPSLGSRPLPTLGEASTDPPHGFFPVFGDDAAHLLLPTISLALITYAAWSRFQRASMLEVINSDYVRLARAKGLSPRRVMVRHALRTALIPMTTVTSLGIAGILGGAIITETVFQWRGMGDFLLKAIQEGDRWAELDWLLLSGFFVVVGNVVADLLYAVLDPRIRYE